MGIKSMLKRLAGQKIEARHPKGFEVDQKPGKGWAYELQDPYTIEMPYLVEGDAFEMWIGDTLWAESVARVDVHTGVFESAYLNVYDPYAFNGASIPAWIRKRIPRWLEWLTCHAALPHDVAYQALRRLRAGLMPEWKPSGGISGVRRRADLCFREHLEADLLRGVGSTGFPRRDSDREKKARQLAGWYFRAVRLFGRGSTKGKP